MKYILNMEECTSVPYKLKADDLINELSTNTKHGLSSAEVLKRKKGYGENKLREKKTTLQRFSEQFKDAMILILIAAAIISFVVGLANGIPVPEIFMTAVSLAVSAIPEGLPKHCSVQAVQNQHHQYFRFPWD
ncbi:MAG: hypothetical protein LUG83_00445 [Lachnospiraceae bacterium]|nr:hypothetical protein [Lachnospiraceae bacterium]